MSLRIQAAVVILLLSCATGAPIPPAATIGSAKEPEPDWAALKRCESGLDGDCKFAAGQIQTERSNGTTVSAEYTRRMTSALATRCEKDDASLCDSLGLLTDDPKVAISAFMRSLSLGEREAGEHLNGRKYPCVTGGQHAQAKVGEFFAEGCVTKDESGAARLNGEWQFFLHGRRVVAGVYDGGYAIDLKELSTEQQTAEKPLEETSGVRIALEMTTRGREGKWQTWHPNGRLASELEYTHGNENGPYLEWYD